MQGPELKWNERGLVPAVVVDARSYAPLMLAWMDREALAATRATGLAHFHSRSRERLWKKGETSGNILSVRDIRVDCDGDALVIIAEPAGPACHTGEASCFFSGLEGGEPGAPKGAPAAVLDRVYRVLQARRDSGEASKSYTRSLFEAGPTAIAGKIEEEAGELTAELSTGEEAAVVHESADLLFHVLVGLCARGIEPRRVWAELERRFGVSGHAEKASRPK